MLLSPGYVTLSQLAEIISGAKTVLLDRSYQENIERSAHLVLSASQGEKAIYGINTGFGKLASTKISPEDVSVLQRNLVLSHCSGVGNPLDENIVRLIMSMKLISLGRGASGVRMIIIEQIENLLSAHVTPMIPCQGSVGASGDLAPLAHMAATLLGEGEAFFEGVKMSSADALAKAGIEPIILSAKEGIALINGTQVSTALALVGLFRAWNALQNGLITGAMSTDAAKGSSAPFHPDIQTLRGHQGQIDTAATLRALISNSEIHEHHRTNDSRVQDPYCIRCQPQVMGAVCDLLRQVGKTLLIEANAVTDNPLILSDGSIVSGGNFHAEPVAFAADHIALAIAEIGSIAQRRIALLVDPTLSFGLPAFLSPNPGINSGLMIAEVTSAALMSENKQRATPASVDSTPTSANQEDHVSMACHGARRLLDMVKNLEYILGIELISAAQGIELRAPLKTSAALNCAVQTLRKTVPHLLHDRYLSPNLESAAVLIASSELCCSVAPVILPQLESL